MKPYNDPEQICTIKGRLTSRNPACADCQVGQGRKCHCRDSSPSIWDSISARTTWWVILVVLGGFWGGLAWRAWEAFK